MLCGKQAGNVPTLMLDRNSCYVIVGKRILLKLEISLLPETVVAFMATFYLLDFDYPKYYELGMNVLQYFAASVVQKL